MKVSGSLLWGSLSTLLARRWAVPDVRCAEKWRGGRRGRSPSLLLASYGFNDFKIISLSRGALGDVARRGLAAGSCECVVRARAGAGLRARFVRPNDREGGHFASKFQGAALLDIDCGRAGGVWIGHQYCTFGGLMTAREPAQ